MNARIYTTDLADDVNPETLAAPGNLSWEDDLDMGHPYGGDHQYGLAGDRLWLYVMPDHPRGLGIQVNGADTGEPSTEALVCSYLEEEGVFDPAMLPAEHRGDERRSVDGELGSEDRDILRFGAELAASESSYYQGVGGLCVRHL